MASDDKKQDEQFDPVTRISIIQAIASNPDRSRAELATMIVLAKYANGRTGACWPSYATIAKDGGMNRRTAIRSVAKLADEGIIKVSKRGERQSPLYNLIKTVASVTHVPRDTNDTIVSPMSPYSVTDDAILVSPMSPEPVIEPGINPVQWMDGGETSPAPPGAGLYANHVADRFPDFWQAFPVRSTVAEAETKIAELVAAGVDLQEIIEGARRYQKYNSATASKKRQSAKQWLSRQSWRDDWTLPVAKQKKTAPPRFNIDRLQDRFTELSLTYNEKAFGALYDEIYQKYVEPHIWPDGKPGDDTEYDETSREKAACPACWDRLYRFKEGTACCSKSMDELAELIDDMDAWSDSLYAKTSKEPPPL